MIKRIFLFAIFTFVASIYVSTPALAGHCPRDVNKINAAMSKMNKMNMSMAMDAAAKGLALHKAGKHGKSLKGLHAAMKSLGVKH